MSVADNIAFSLEVRGTGKVQRRKRADELLELVALNVPSSLHQTLPLMMILCSIMLFLSLSKSNELVVTRAAGRSAVRSLIGPITAAFLIGVISIILLNPIVAGTKKQYENRTSELSNLPINTSYLSANGLWLRQGNETTQTVLPHAGTFGVPSDHKTIVIVRSVPSALASNVRGLK